MSLILATLTSGNDSDFESSNVSLKENKPDGVNPNSNDIEHCVLKNEGSILWFSADCILKATTALYCVSQCTSIRSKIRLRQAMILISKVRTLASKKINLMALIRTLTLTGVQGDIRCKVLAALYTILELELAL